MEARAIVRFALVTAALLLVPLFSMQFTDEVDWDLGDFVVGGALLFGAGLTYEVVAQRGSTVAYRVAVGVAVGALLLLAWAGLAVGVP